MHKHDREATVQRELRTMLETQLQDKTVEFTAINAQMEAVKIEAATSKHVHSQDMQVMNDKLAKQLQEQKQQIDIVKSKNETLMVRSLYGMSCHVWHRKISLDYNPKMILYEKAKTLHEKTT